MVFVRQFDFGHNQTLVFARKYVDFPVQIAVGNDMADLFDDVASKVGIAYSNSRRRRFDERDLRVKIALPSSLMRTRIDTFAVESR